MNRGKGESSPCVICGSASFQRIEKDSYRLFQCGECGHLFLYPIPTLDELREGYTIQDEGISLLKHCLQLQ